MTVGTTIFSTGLYYLLATIANLNSLLSPHASAQCVREWGAEDVSLPAPASVEVVGLLISPFRLPLCKPKGQVLRLSLRLTNYIRRY